MKFKTAAWTYFGYALVDAGRAGEAVGAYREAANILLHEPVDLSQPEGMTDKSVDAPVQGVSPERIRLVAESFWHQAAKLSSLL